MYALSDCHCSLLSAFSVATSPPKDSHNPTALSLAHHDIDHFDGSKQTQSGSLLTENALISEPRTSTIDAIDGSAYSADPDHSYSPQHGIKPLTPESAEFERLRRGHGCSISSSAGSSSSGSSYYSRRRTPFVLEEKLRDIPVLSDGDHDDHASPSTDDGDDGDDDDHESAQRERFKSYRDCALRYGLSLSVMLTLKV